jgi:hypothetical protein
MHIRFRVRHGRDRMIVGFITTYTISVYHHKRCEFKPRLGEVYSVQHYVIKFVSDLRQVGGFLRGTPDSSTNITDRHDITEILLKVALKKHKT